MFFINQSLNCQVKGVAPTGLNILLIRTFYKDFIPTGFSFEYTTFYGNYKKGHSLLLPILVADKDYWPFVTKVLSTKAIQKQKATCQVFKT
jgi:hypothetical protein